MCPSLCLQSSDSALSVCQPNDDKEKGEFIYNNSMIESPTHWAVCFMHSNLKSLPG